jgi:class 3 adenylate cyclase
VRPPARLAEKIRAGRGALEGERKQVTVLFGDVIGSMELAERHDPEEWRALMDRFFSVLSAGVHRFEGTVDKFTGDGIMALFGAPVAHEDHARRGGYAALALQADLADLPFAVRMGLNSGEVVVGAIGEDLAMEYTAIGRTVGLAQRMEQLAAPDSVYLSEHTAALVEGYLELADLGEFEVKGVTRPLRVYALAGVGTAHGRLDVSRARGFSRFVGRDAELRALEDAQARAAAWSGSWASPGWARAA